MLGHCRREILGHAIRRVGIRVQVDALCVNVAGWIPSGSSLGLIGNASAEGSWGEDVYREPRWFR